MIRLDLITGFLGTGKTTFIMEYIPYLLSRGERVAVIVNDYGAINVDRLILEESLGQSVHLEMVIGGDPDCGRRRLKTKLIAMAMSGYTHVVVEPSGIFDVDDFLDMIYEEPLERWYSMGSIITLADTELLEATFGKSVSDSVRYLYASQLSKAGVVVLSKLEDRDPAEVTDRVLTYINDILITYRCSRRMAEKDLYIWRRNAVSEEDFGRIYSSGYSSGEMIKLPVAEEGFDSVFYFHVKTDIGCIRETITRLFGDSSLGHIIRLKGFLPLEGGRWLEINATRGRVDTREVSVGQELFIVIGESLDKDAIGEYWDEYRNEV